MRFTKIYVEITNICNLNCSFCSKTKRKKEEMSPANFKIIIDKIKNYTNTIYLHVLGEPLLHSKLNDILEICKKNKINVRITTNGTLLKEKVNILLKYSSIIKQINISLHCENKIPNYFEQVFEYANILSSKIPIVYRIWLLDNYNLDKLSTLIVDKIITFYKLNINFKNEVINSKNIKIKDNIYLDKDNKFIWPDNKNKINIKTGTCLGTRTHIAILVNGDVVPCCLDANCNLKLDNIFNSNLEEIMNTPLFKEINTGFKNQKLITSMCQSCTFRKLKFDK